MRHSSFTVSHEVCSIWSCDTCSLYGLGGWDPLLVWERGCPIWPSPAACDGRAACTDPGDYHAAHGSSSRAVYEDSECQNLRCLPPRCSFCWCPPEIASCICKVLPIFSCKLWAWRILNRENLVTASTDKHRFTTSLDLQSNIILKWYLYCFQFMIFTLLGAAANYINILSFILLFVI